MAYNHATVNDLFRNAIGAAEVVTSDIDDRRKKEADAFLYALPGAYETHINNFKRDNPFNYKGNPDDPVELDNYTHEYELKLKAEAERFLKGKLGRNANIPYYKKKVDALGNLSFNDLKNYALVEQDKWRADYENMSLVNDIKSYVSNIGDIWTPKETLRTVANRISLAAERIQLGPQQKNKLYNDAAVASYDKFASALLGAVNDVNKLEGTMQRVRDDFKSMTNTLLEVYDENGNVSDTQEKPWTFDGREEYEAKLIKRETERIQQGRFSGFREQKSLLDRMLLSGNLDAAIDHCRVWGAELNKYYNPRNPEYANLNDDLRDRASNWFDVGKIEGYKKQELGKEIALLDAYNLEMFLRPQIIGGDGTVIVGFNERKEPITMQYKSLNEALKGFIYFKREAFMQSKGGEHSVNLQLWEAEQTKFFEKFYSEVGTALKQINPTLALDFDKFMQNDFYIREDSGFYNSDIKKMSLYERDAYGQRCVNFYKSILFNGVTDVAEIRNAMRKFTSEELFKFMTKAPTENSEENQLKQLKAFSDIAMSEEAEDIVWVNYNPERFNVSGQTNTPSYEFRSPDHEKAVNQVAENERKILANILGFPVDGFLSEWMASDRRKGDVIPKQQFTIKSKLSLESGTFYLNYEANGRPVVMKQNASGSWDVYKKAEGAITKDEYIEAIRNGKNPKTGEDFDYSRPPPGSPVAESTWNSAYYSRYPLVKYQAWADFFMKLEQGRWK